MGIRVKIMNAHDPVRICGDLLTVWAVADNSSTTLDSTRACALCTCPCTSRARLPASPNDRLVSMVSRHPSPTSSRSSCRRMHPASCLCQVCGREYSAVQVCRVAGTLPICSPPTPSPLSAQRSPRWCRRPRRSPSLPHRAGTIERHGPNVA